MTEEPRISLEDARKRWPNAELPVWRDGRSLFPSIEDDDGLWEPVFDGAANIFGYRRASAAGDPSTIPAKAKIHTELRNGEWTAVIKAQGYMSLGGRGQTEAEALLAAATLWRREELMRNALKTGVA